MPIDRNFDSVAALTEQVRTFCEDRDWDQFHTPKDLAIGIVTEASELLDLFRFKNEEQIRAILDGAARERVEEEVADVLFFLLRFAQLYNMPLGQILTDKIRKNEAKYPVEVSRGSNLKYTERSKPQEIS